MLEPLVSGNTITGARITGVDFDSSTDMLYAAVYDSNGVLQSLACTKVDKAGEYKFDEVIPEGGRGVLYLWRKMVSLCKREI